MASITLTQSPIFKSIEAKKAEDGTLVLYLTSRAYVGSTPVDVRSVIAISNTPQEWDGGKWETVVADAVEADYVAAGYVYPA